MLGRYFVNSRVCTRCLKAWFKWYTVFFSPKYRLQVDESKLRIRSACITATPANVLSEPVDYDTTRSSSSSSNESIDMPDLENIPVVEPGDGRLAGGGNIPLGSTLSRDIGDDSQTSGGNLPTDLTSANGQEVINLDGQEPPVIVVSSVVDNGSQPHSQNGCQQVDGLVAMV